MKSILASILSLALITPAFAGSEVGIDIQIGKGFSLEIGKNHKHRPAKKCKRHWHGDYGHYHCFRYRDHRH